MLRFEHERMPEAVNPHLQTIQTKNWIQFYKFYKSHFNFKCSLISKDRKKPSAFAVSFPLGLGTIYGYLMACYFKPTFPL